jgi:hypothetical protein
MLANRRELLIHPGGVRGLTEDSWSVYEEEGEGKIENESKGKGEISRREEEGQAREEEQQAKDGLAFTG